MAKRDDSGNRSRAVAKTTAASGASTTAEGIEQRVMAFAEQLGRIAGTVQAKAEGWMDRDALSKQIAGVRDSASELLEQLKSTVSTAASDARKAATAETSSKAEGRSGGFVHAPGKKHRRPAPLDPRAIAAAAMRATTQAAKSGVKTMKQRGRG